MVDNDRLIEYAGKFRLIRRIARGGMATVYEAEQVGDRGFTKRVALKVIHEKYAREPEWLQLFIDEAKLSANLVHGNIVQIFQFEEVDGQFYMAMEYIRGVTVRALIDRHRATGDPVPPELAAYIVSRVSRALDFAHNFADDLGNRLYIVHRDVSPGNILLTWDGQVKLGDFGIAKARTMHDPAESQQLTIGKKHYMSPEQVLGMRVDWRSDIFSTAVVLFELLAREQLFREIETEAAMDEVTIAPTPNVARLLPDIDQGLAGLITLAISKAPLQRPNAAIFGATLDQWCVRQRRIGSPERLQSHLAQMFPTTYSPPVEAPARREGATPG
jgi:eukaryotic-like serine/threonine-protein kinase